jgi:hypothetical protein
LNRTLGLVDLARVCLVEILKEVTDAVIAEDDPDDRLVAGMLDVNFVRADEIDVTRLDVMLPQYLQRGSSARS